jgi:hypothetical protein
MLLPQAYLTVLAIAKQLLVAIFLFKASIGKTSGDLFTLTIRGGVGRTFSSLPAARMLFNSLLHTGLTCTHKKLVNNLTFFLSYEHPGLDSGPEVSWL